MNSYGLGGKVALVTGGASGPPPSGLADTERNGHHRNGWELNLGRLSLASTGRDAGVDPNG